MSDHNDISDSDQYYLEAHESNYSIKRNEPNSNMDNLGEAIQNKMENDTIRSTSSKRIQTPADKRLIICLQSDSNDSCKCISPCFCRGSISMVHKKCLEMWLEESISNNCEICKFEFKTKRILKYSLLGSIKAWLFGNERPEVNELKRNVWLLLLTPVVVIYVINRIFFANNTTIGKFVAFVVSLIILSVNFSFVFWITCYICHIAKWFDFYKNSHEVIMKFGHDVTLKIKY